MIVEPFTNDNIWIGTIVSTSAVLAAAYSLKSEMVEMKLDLRSELSELKSDLNNLKQDMKCNSENVKRVQNSINYSYVGITIAIGILAAFNTVTDAIKNYSTTLEQKAKIEQIRLNNERERKIIDYDKTKVELEELRQMMKDSNLRNKKK